MLLDGISRGPSARTLAPAPVKPLIPNGPSIRPADGCQLTMAASCFLTCAADGLVSAVPSGNRTVGTVWLPPFTDITNSAAASSRSMSTSTISIPSRASCLFRLRQYPHHVVVYIVSWPDTHCLLDFASAKSRFCNTGGDPGLPG